MSQPNLALAEQLQKHFGHWLVAIDAEKDLVTVQVTAEHLIPFCEALRDQEPFQFDQLMDVCGVDFLTYGETEWRSTETTDSGFSRGTEIDVENPLRVLAWQHPRFASVYHLLSVALNQRLRIHVYLNENHLSVPSVCSVWAAANWFERESYDLYGIVYEGHPDLRRLLTDYGFVGHPFRKDFPVIGEVELRYDASLQRCVYEPVSIQPRITVPKVIRRDNRYLHPETANKEGQ